MKESVLNILKCPKCESTGLFIEGAVKDEIEIRQGLISCGKCGKKYRIEAGIIDFLDEASENVSRERKAMDEDDYIADEKGIKYRINRESIQKFKDKFLSFPEGDGSYFFKKGGSFQSTAEASGRFYSALEDMHLTGSERILEIGACFSYASFKFAQKGCQVIALDISNYLKVSDLYIKRAFFERLFADMHRMPFGQDTFDIVFGSAVLHHSKDLPNVFREIKRVLKPKGRLILINEAARGVFEKIHPVYKQMQEKGFGDTAYNILEWKKAARLAGLRRLKAVFTSLADDYVRKYENRAGKRNLKVILAYFFKRHRLIERSLMFFLILPRMFFRPKSWRLIAYK